MLDLRRREFITLLGGAAVTWPLAAWAQSTERVRQVGVLSGSAADDPDAQTRLTALRQGLQGLGWIEGRNLRIDARWGAKLAAKRLELLLANRRAPAGPSPTDAERIELFKTAVFGSGTYRLEGNKLITRYDTSWHQAWTGAERVNTVEITGKTLTSTCSPSKAP